MIPLIKSIFLALLWDPMAARRWLRGASLTLAVGGVAFADQLADIIGAPKAVKTIKLAALICGFVGGATSVGERNAKPEATP